MNANAEQTLSQLADANDGVTAAVAGADTTVEETTLVEDTNPIVTTEVVETPDTNADTATGEVIVNSGSEAEVIAVPAVAEKRKSGRPRDVSGNSTLGRARLLYEANPTWTGVQLRDAIVAATGCKPTVASTYSSIVRKG